MKTPGHYMAKPIMPCFEREMRALLKEVDLEEKQLESVIKKLVEWQHKETATLYDAVVVVIIVMSISYLYTTLGGALI